MPTYIRKDLATELVAALDFGVTNISGNWQGDTDVLDMIFAGQSSNTDIGERLMAANFNPDVLRPFDHKGRTYVTVNNKTQLVTNAPATLTHQAWLTVDAAIQKAAKPRLRAVDDLKAAGLVYSLPGGMATSVMMSQNQSDIGPATISMNGIRAADSDRPHFGSALLPIPIIHKDFQLDLRQIMASRRGEAALDLTNAELAARRVAEEAEQLVLGNRTAAYGGGNVYGYKNFPNRITGTVTAPTAMGWVPADTVHEVGLMKQASSDAFFYGPWILYHGPAWATYMDEDYSGVKGDNTLRDRIKKMQDIKDVKQLDYLTGFDLILLQQTSDVARLVEGMGMTTLQWDSHGGMMKNFKVMVIWVPQVRCDFNSHTGLVHYTTA